ncbi:hypothetical protein JW926_03185, partial [Candidatus Sumerlaeota bacterium]|nr:hypothetical protein [Candidatus Sumerlaeota bacterium]
LNGKYIGEHLGNWAPFVFQITDSYNPDGKNVLIIRVEELPRHFSAGFPRELGNFAGYDSHFGGLWQDVTLYPTGDIHIDNIFVMPGLGAEKVDVKANITGSSNAHGSLSCSIYKPDGALVEEKVKNISFEGWNKPFDVEFSMPVVKPVAWRPDNPALYRAVIQARTGEEVSQKETIRFGMRDVKTEGSRLLLNGEPIYVRGMLHWGYYPNLFSITPSEEQIRREFQDLRACGFNLVKVCLFIFPRRFYEIADETGMLIWEEYPTWMTIPKPGDSRMREVMRREYSEWFRFDRNFPSIILRSLTCEAQNYDEEFLSSLYQLGKEMTNGSVMADNSGFLNHTITDWYDMHSYRELHDHYGTMDWIAKTVREKPEIKPFITGEDMDFDTYRDMQSIRSAFLGSGEIPWWLANNNFKEQEKFEEGIKKEINADAPGMMVRMQKRRALSVRQALFGEYRRHEEFAGYVMTSIRDNPYTRPGFYDDLMNPKWSPEEWTRFNADRVLIFRAHGNDSSTPAESSEQPRHSFCFMADEDIRFRIYFSNYGANLEGGELKWRLVNMDKTILVKGSMRVGAKRGELKALPDFSIALPQNIIGTQAPLQCRFETEIGEGETITRNDVPVWIFPSRGNAAIGKGIAVYIYSPKGSDDYAGVFPGLRGETVTPVTGEDKWKLSRSGEKISFDPGTKAILLTDHLDEPVKTALRKGAKVLYIPCEESGKDIPRYDYEIFWRESVIWLPPEHPLWGDFPHQGFVDLQFLDMTCKSPFNAEGFRDGIRPLIWGFNPRIPGYRIRDYVFESAVGEGKILACALNLFGERNPAGEYFLKCLLQYAASGDFDPKRNPGEHPLERLSGIRE